MPFNIGFSYPNKFTYIIILNYVCENLPNSKQKGVWIIMMHQYHFFTADPILLLGKMGYC